LRLSEDSRLVYLSQQPAIRPNIVWLFRLQMGLHRIAALWVARLQRRREGEVLRTFSDRKLLDLGLNRSDIQAIIKGTYHPR
jgi:uncharacterized protein YjiS (DUF1127 family)